MSHIQEPVVWSVLVGFIVGSFLVLFGTSIHYRTASMRYGEGQVLMLLLDTYPETTTDARAALIRYLGDGYITHWEYDVILLLATRAVFYDRGDVMRPLVMENPCLTP